MQYWTTVRYLIGTRALRAAAVPTLLLSLMLGMPAAPADANGAPIRIVLAYQMGVSTWGPTNATGVAELVTKEGEVRLTATGLPQLSGEQYQLWIVNTASGDRLALGGFKPGEDGAAKLDLVLRDSIPDQEWDLMLVSIEADGSQPAEPGTRRSVAGRFPPPTGSETRPGQLPNTGDSPAPAPEATEPEAASRIPGVGTVLLGLGISGLVGFGIGRVTGRGRTA